ncbi:mitochondrial molecular chaperone [Podospora conica]|nr:mitochondrial molecular chaperone [Schizothecium conicum]
MSSSLARSLRLLPLRPTAAAAASRACFIHTSTPHPAKVEPVYGTGPPPEPPAPAEYSPAAARLARRRRQAEMLRHALDIRAASKASSTSTTPGGLRKRFWKDVSVQSVNGALEIHLDSRPLRHPHTKAPIRLPPSKPALALLLAAEWDALPSAADATRQHLIPLTSLACRALDLCEAADAEKAALADTLLRYLDTDALLCLAPPHKEDDPGNKDGRHLRELQEEAMRPVVEFLCGRVWPGTRIRPVLEGDSIVPMAQEEGTREVVQGWVMGLSGWELAGLERATLAGKSLLVAARLVAGWSEDGAGVEAGEVGFGAEEAARAVSVEVAWQTGRWGEVEDTHDVEKEDVRRQLASAVLLVTGTGRGRGGV